MRWERLFEDLQAQVDADEAAGLLAEVADRTRRERAALGLHERLAAARHTTTTVSVAGLGTQTTLIADVGADWVLLRLGPRDALVPFAALRSVAGLSGRVGAPSQVAKGFTLGAALRAVSRDRAAVLAVLVDGQQLSGTIDAVGADALDLARHPADLPRRPENVFEVLTIPYAAIGAVLRQ